MADLEVIYDSGHGVPASPYLAYLVSVVSAADAADTGENVMPGLRFPISTRLRADVLPAEKEGAPVLDAQWQAQPVFLVGADARSLGWLAFNRWRLLRAAAWGLVVQADDALAFRAVQSIAPDLKFAPLSGDWLDSRLIAAGVAVYPILIDTDGIARQALPADRYGPSGAAFDAPVQPAQPLGSRP